MFVGNRCFMRCLMKYVGNVTCPENGGARTTRSVFFSPCPNAIVNRNYSLLQRKCLAISPWKGSTYDCLDTGVVEQLSSIKSHRLYWFKGFTKVSWLLEAWSQEINEIYVTESRVVIVNCDPVSSFTFMWRGMLSSCFRLIAIKIVASMKTTV